MKVAEKETGIPSRDYKPKEPSLLWMSVVLTGLLCLPILIVAVVANWQLAHYGTDRILTVQQLRQLPDTYRMGLMFGASVRGDGSLSGVMSERVSTVAALLQQTAVTRVVLSGYGGSSAYDEVAAATHALEDAGIRATQLIADPAGVRTLVSLQNYKKDFPTQNVVLISHRYHLRRALYLADRLHIKAVGVAAGSGEGYSSLGDWLRETAARLKAWAEGWFV